MTDDEIMAAALLCPESEKIPLEVGDRVIALEGHYYYPYGNRVEKGDMGVVTEVYPNLKIKGPLHVCVKWDGQVFPLYHPHQHIGKLVKREGAEKKREAVKRKPKISIEEQLYRAGIWEKPGNPLKDAIADGIAGLWRSLAMLARPGIVFDPREIACLKKMNKLNRQKYILRALKQREEAK